jgi:biopolymer transport protein ExbB/TolQ
MDFVIQMLTVAVYAVFLFSGHRWSSMSRTIKEISYLQLDIRQKLHDIQLQIDQLQRRNAVSALNIQEKIFNEQMKKLPPANRKPRTEEQKRKMSEDKKRYWAERRAQEQNTPAPVEV